MLNTILILTALKVMQPHYPDARVLTTVPAELLEEGGCDNYDFAEPSVISQGDAEEVTL